MQPSILGETLEDLERRLEPPWRARQILEALHRGGADAFQGITALPAGLRRRLASEWTIDPLSVRLRRHAADGTVKFLFGLPDGAAVETVLIPARGRRTLCVSTQVGCAVRCAFCASGIGGLERNLSAAEIVVQVRRAGRETGGPVDHVVMMGMGEPFQNYAAVMKALIILSAPWGLGIGRRRITVSTSGIPEGIRSFGQEAGQIRLAISLHAATDDLRNRLVPINRRYPLRDVLDAVRDYQTESGRQVTWEYVLLAGTNDAPEQAAALAGLVKPFRGRVNLIPCNPVAGMGSGAPPSRARVTAFRDVLERAGALVTVRRDRGRDIEAACGQLRMRLEPTRASPPA